MTAAECRRRRMTAAEMASAEAAEMASAEAAEMTAAAAAEMTAAAAAETNCPRTIGRERQGTEPNANC